MLHRFLEEQVRQAIRLHFPNSTFPVAMQPCADRKFGDYQCSSVIAIAKEARINPREAAAKIAGSLDVGRWCEPPQIAGPGFINFRLKEPAIAEALASALRGEHLFFDRPAHPQKIVIDFSSPNVAKSMHVGHIRSTILGDSLARTFRFLGHSVVTDNHIGDWGTQFGKLLVGWKRELDRERLAADPMGEMERLYKKINAEAEADLAILEAARAELVKLQKEDPENLAIWREMIRLSRQDFERLYARLGVAFDEWLGESCYNDRLQGVVQELIDRGIARESEGAIVVFFDDIPELKATPVVVRKGDGAANYTTTDLAALQYRLERWDPDKVIYVTDGRQQLHFKQLFAIFRKWKPEARVQLQHVWFGMVLGPDGKPFKTKSGENIKLAELLDEAVERVRQVVNEKNPELSGAQKEEVARVVGLGAVKYSDLLPNRQSDYVFSWDKMLSLNGNTAPYLQYAYTRIRGILRKDAADPGPIQALRLSAPAELALARHLLNFGISLEAALEECRPNFLCNYLYELASLFASFYENCPVLKAAPEERDSRLALCALTGRVLRQGLELLGIEVTEVM